MDQNEAFFDTYIYAADLGQGLVKIGNSVCVNRRMRRLGKYYNCEVILLGAFLSFKKYEIAFHHNYKSYAVYSEVYLFDSLPVAHVLPHLLPYGKDGEHYWRSRPVVPWGIE